MSDEEKKAVEYWKTHMEILHWNTQLASEHYIKVLLELIEKQQKEIEKYKNVIDNREFTWKQKYEETFEYVNENFINKDKIKAKIEEIDEVLKGQLIEKIRVYFEAQKEVLQSLLEKE